MEMRYQASSEVTTIGATYANINLEVNNVPNGYVIEQIGVQAVHYETGAGTLSFYDSFLSFNDGFNSFIYPEPEGIVVNAGSHNVNLGLTYLFPKEASSRFMEVNIPLTPGSSYIFDFYSYFPALVAGDYVNMFVTLVVEKQ
jgi:hypothetical protein